MKRYFVHPRMMLAALAAVAALCSPLSVQAYYPGFPSMEESEAFRQYKLRPPSENSKLIYLIDRFSDTEIEILYDSHFFSAKFSGRVARWFLARHYKQEKAETWIMRWCNTSTPAGHLIWVKLPNGKFRLAREILFEELKVLDTFFLSQSGGPPLKTDLPPAGLPKLVSAATAKANP